MAKRLGDDRRVWVESSTVPGTYQMVKGNQALTISRSRATIDGTTKDTQEAINLPGVRNSSLRCSFQPEMPDANGYERLEAVARAAVPAPLNVQVRKGAEAGVDPGDVEYQCSMYVTDDNTDHSQKSVSTNDFTLVPAAAPTIDKLK